MGLVPWTTEYEIGQERIDRAHRDLFDCNNRFHDAWYERQDRREIFRLQSLLIEYVERHFRNEERSMRGYVPQGLPRRTADKRGRRRVIVAAGARPVPAIEQAL